MQKLTLLCFIIYIFYVVVHVHRNEETKFIFNTLMLLHSFFSNIWPKFLHLFKFAASAPKYVKIYSCMMLHRTFSAFLLFNNFPLLVLLMLFLCLSIYMMLYIFFCSKCIHNAWLALAFIHEIPFVQLLLGMYNVVVWILHESKNKTLLLCLPCMLVTARVLYGK